MSSYYVYIIYSRQINHYYVGSSGDVGRRIQEHNEGLYAGSFSKQSKDWELYLQIECKDIIHARKVEEHIKRMKSRKYIEDLKRYEELRGKLVKTYQ